MSDNQNTATRRVVVGVDGSPESILALRHAQRLAPVYDAAIDAITAWSYPASIVPLPAAWDPEADANNIVHDAVRDVFGEASPENVTARAQEGNPARVLIDASRQAELVIVGSRGHGGFTGLLLGSVSAQVAEHAACPVLVVHDR